MWENALIVLSKQPPASLVNYMAHSSSTVPTGVVGAKTLSTFRGEEFAGADNIKVEAVPDDDSAANESANRALQYVGKFVKYDLYRRNCEHFARWCFDQNGRSTQLENVGDAVLGSSAAVVGGTAASIVATPAASTGILATVTGFAAPYSAGMIAPLATPAAPIYAVGIAAVGTAAAAAYGAHKMYNYLAYADDTFPIVAVPALPSSERHAYIFDGGVDEGNGSRMFKRFATLARSAARMSRASRRSRAARTRESAV